MRHKPTACSGCRSTSTFTIEDRAVISASGNSSEWFVWCPGCGTDGPRHRTQEQAENAWAETNPVEILTDWFLEADPSPHEGVAHPILRHLLVDELDQYEQTRITLAGGRVMDVWVKKGKA